MSPRSLEVRFLGHRTGTDERGAAILDELKTILQSRGSADLSPDDTYYSMPVSEIDFSNCRQCTPSYRALPDNYPNVAVSEASPPSA